MEPMSDFCGCWRRIRLRVATGVAAPVLFTLGGAVVAAGPRPASQPPGRAVDPAAAVHVFDLAACRRIALANNPSVAAARASLSAAVVRSQSLDRLHVPTFLARDLPIRRKQSQLGITIQQGMLTQA